MPTPTCRKCNLPWTPSPSEVKGHKRTCKACRRNRPMTADQLDAAAREAVHRGRVAMVPRG